MSQETFDVVQENLRKNSGRSRTLSPHPELGYLLNGLVCCAFCGMPMWAQTYKSGQRFYTEHRASRSIEDCPSARGSIKCDILEEQIRRIISAIELGPAWQEQVLSLISVQDEVERVREERRKVNEKTLASNESLDEKLLPCSWWRRGRVGLYEDTYLRHPIPATELMGVGVLAA